MIVKITIEKNNIAILEASQDSLDLIDRHFTYPDYSNCWIYGKFKNENIKMQHFLIRSEGIKTMGLLPIGLLDEAELYIKSQKGKYKIFDNRKIKKFKFSDEEIKDSITYLQLYPYQIEAVQKCLEKTNGIVKAATASGKTEIFISLCKLMKVKTLILFARIDLAHQTLRRMKKADLDAGIVQGNNIDENHLVVMATVQSAHKLQNTYDMVIIDETHKASSEQYQDILRNDSFKYRYGFSATPFVKTNKLKNAHVKSFIGDLIFEINPQHLIKEQRIAEPHIKFIPITFPKDILDLSRWSVVEKMGIVDNTYRNKMIAKLCQTLVGQTLILVIKIDQGEELNKLIPNSHLLFGKTKVKERQDVTARFDAGEEITLIASTIFDEGIDIKNIHNVVICGGGTSFIKTLQRLGRGLRITETKKEVNIYDFYDYTNPLLEKHSKNRMTTYRHEGFEDVEVLSIQDLLKLIKDT